MMKTSTLFKAILFAMLLMIAVLVVLPFTQSPALSPLRDSSLGVKLSDLLDQPISAQAVRNTATDALEEIAAAQNGAEPATPQTVSTDDELTALAAQIAELENPQAFTFDKAALTQDGGTKKSPISDIVDENASIKMLEQETGINQEELKSLLSPN